MWASLSSVVSSGRSPDAGAARRPTAPHAPNPAGRAGDKPRPARPRKNRRRVWGPAIEARRLLVGRPEVPSIVILSASGVRDAPPNTTAVVAAPASTVGPP